MATVQQLTALHSASKRNNAGHAPSAPSVKGASRKQSIRTQMRREKGESQALGLGTLPELRKEAGQEAHVEYEPIINTIRQEAAGAAKREGEIPGWYAGVAQSIGANAQGAAQSAAATQQGVNQRLQESSASQNAQLQRLSQGNAGLAKLLGGPENNAGIAQEAAGQGAEQREAVALNSPIAAQASALQTYLGQKQTAAGERGIQGADLEHGRREKIMEDLGKAQKLQGEKSGADLSLLQKGAREYMVDSAAVGKDKAESFEDIGAGQKNRAEVGEVHAKTGKLNAQIPEAKAKTANQYAEAAKNNAYASYGGLTPSEEHHALAERNTALALVHRAVAAHGAHHTPAEWAALEGNLKTTGTNPALIRWAVQRLRQSQQQSSLNSGL